MFLLVTKLKTISVKYCLRTENLCTRNLHLLKCQCLRTLRQHTTKLSGMLLNDYVMQFDMV